MNLAQTEQLTTKDAEFAKRVDNRAHAQAEHSFHLLAQAHKDAVELNNPQPIVDFINRTIEDTKCFGLAQALMSEVEGFTEATNQALDRGKPLFGKVPEHVVHKAEIARFVILANWLRTAFEELQAELKSEGN